MAETYSNKHVTLRLNVSEHTAEMKKRLRKGVMRAAEELATQIKRNISTPTRSSGPSSPGEFPHADTGLLRNSITWKMVGELSAVVGSKLNYAIWLEFGVTGTKTIFAAPGKVFHWKNARGEDVFAKSFTFKGIEARPFLRPTLDQMLPRLQEIITGASGGAAEFERVEE